VFLGGDAQLAGQPAYVVPFIGQGGHEEAVDWLRDHYGQFEFWVVRDLV
jgi:hypothetical protein